MTWELNALAAVLLVTAATAASVALVAWRRRAAPGATALAGLMLAVVGWTCLRGLEAGAVDIADKVLWARLQYFGISGIGPLWLLFALDYARRVTLSRRSLAILFLVPAVSVALALTNGPHHLIWTTIARNPRHPELLVYGHGAFFWVLLAYTYLLLAAGTAVLGLAIVRFPATFRVQAGALVLAVILPWCGNAIYIAGLSPISGLDLTPLAMTLSGVVGAWLTLRRDLFDLIPMARETLAENLGDGVVVLDERNRIVYINPAATRLLPLSGHSPIGASAGQVLAAWPGLVTALEGRTGTTGEIATAGGHYLDFQISPLQDLRRRVTGRLVSLRDVTARRQAENALRESEARFRAIFEHAPDAYYLSDLEGRFVDGNRAAEALVRHRKADLIGRSFLELDLLAAEDLPRAAGLLARSQAGLPTGPDEFTLRRGDGTNVGVEISTAPFTLGGQMLVLGIARDVTVRRRTQDALRESEERYRDLVENVEELICTHDMTGRLLTANRALVRAMGCERPEDLVGRSLVEFLAADVRHLFPGYLETIRAVGRASGLMKVETRDGRRRYLEFDNTLGRDATGQPIARGVARDVTERLRMEREIRTLNEQLEQKVEERTAELRRAQERFETLAQVAPVGIYRTDRWGQVTYVNDRWCHITGLTAEQAHGVGYLQMIHPDDLARFLTPWRATAGLPGGYHIEMRIRRPDGAVVWVTNELMAQVDEQGREVGAVGTLTDITELRRAEQTRALLARRVIDAQEEERARLARELHDETGQTLASLRIGLGLLKSARLPAAARAQVDRLIEVATAALEGVRWMAWRLRPSVLDDLGLQAALERYVSEFCRTQGLRVTLDVKGLKGRRLSPTVETALYRIAQEALTNAGRHAEATHAAVCLTVGSTSADLMIVDDGRGFVPEEALPAATASGHLGLQTMRERAMGVGASLAIDSAPGRGTRIAVQVPLPNGATP